MPCPAMKSLLLICLLLGPSTLLAIPSSSFSSLPPLSSLISLLLFSSSSSLSYFSYSGGQPGTSPRFVHFTRQLYINNLRFQPLYGSLQVNVHFIWPLLCLFFPLKTLYLRWWRAGCTSCIPLSSPPLPPPPRPPSPLCWQSTQGVDSFFLLQK